MYGSVSSPSKGSRFQHSGGSYSLGYYTAASTPTQVSNTQVDASTVETRWTAGDLGITQVVTYTSGTDRVYYEWRLTNTGGSALPDLRFFHGQDTYLFGGDTGAGFWEDTLKAIGVSKTLGSQEQRMYLQGVTAPYAYESRDFWSVKTSVQSGALTNQVDPNPNTDNGYALEWRLATLNPGDTWTIVAYESFTMGSALSYVYLPLVTKAFVPTPDLVVDDLIATSSTVTVTIRNAGTATVVDAFWLDVYFNPSQTPTVNHRWSDIASHGSVWGVTKSLYPGETLVLTTDDAYYHADKSSTPPLPVGANVYALVDSINYATTYGAVQESDEGNNLSGPVVSTAGVGGGAGPVGKQGQLAPREGLPPR